MLSYNEALVISRSVLADSYNPILITKRYVYNWANRLGLKDWTNLSLGEIYDLCVEEQDRIDNSDWDI